jgi:ATP-dependent Zn protease
MEPSENRKRSTKSQLRIAFHEAGHVIAARVLGMPINKATIIPEHDTIGHVKYANPLRDVKLDCDSSDEARRRAERTIIIIFAGPAALRKYSPGSSRFLHARGDFEEAAELAGRIDATIEPLLERLNRMAEDLVEAHWHDVVIIAEALVKEQTLDHNRIEEILETAAAMNS